MRGGKREGAGRKKGSRDKAKVALDAMMASATADLPAGFTALVLFQRVYRDEAFPMVLRMHAAEKAIPYESPRLSTVEHSGPNGQPIPLAVNVKFVGASAGA